MVSTRLSIASRWCVTSIVAQRLPALLLLSCLASCTNARGLEGRASLPGRDDFALLDQRTCWVGFGLRTYDPDRNPPGRIHEAPDAWLFLEVAEGASGTARHARVSDTASADNYVMAEWYWAGQDSLIVRETRFFPSIVYHLVVAGDTLRGESVLVHDLVDRSTGENLVSRRPVEVTRAACVTS